MADTRLIERWLPIAELGIESVRERTPMTPFPAPNRLHVWWARRPLVASRAAVLASFLPENADRKKFMHAIGIHGDPVRARRLIDRARRTGQRVDNPYGYDRAFGFCLDENDRANLEEALDANAESFKVLDPTAGGGSIPFEAARLGFETFANDSNPVAALIMAATIEWPLRFGMKVEKDFKLLSERWRRLVQERLETWFPQSELPHRVDMTYIWARTVSCPYCEGVVPLSPNWRLAPDGTGVKLAPRLGDGPGSEDRICAFEVVKSAAEQSPGTIKRGTGICPWPDCERVIGGDEIKEQARAGRMGEQLFAVVYKQLTKVRTKTGKTRDKWVRAYRAPRSGDDNAFEIQARLDEKLPEWEAFDIVPSEPIPDGHKTTEPQRYGMTRWRDLFSPRQLLCHGTSVEIFREMLDADRKSGALTPVRKAAYGYLALALDKLVDYNSFMSVWHPGREVMAHTFTQHDFSFKWSYAEMAPLVTGAGYDWAMRQTAKAAKQLVGLVRPGDGGALLGKEGANGGAPPVTITCQPGDQLADIADASIDAVVMDPPYYDNVMYAELSDFFYVWLKRTAGHVFPELFRGWLTDKDSEAVANPARFAGGKGARALAGRDYRQRMASIFAECRRVLKPDGIMTVMFTHKATGAWDALATGLMEAGFAITASWPIDTEAEGSLHIKNKAAAKSTVFLVCRPRGGDTAADDGETMYWEDIAPRVARAVRARMEDFHEAGLAGVDIYLASFGPALEEFSRHWPLERGTPRKKPKTLIEEDRDPYAATPEDALDAARREVGRWQLERLTRRAAGTDLDPATSFFVLAWRAFRAPAFSYDEALRLARAVGVDLDRDIVGRLAEKKGSDLRLWDSAVRAAKGALGPPDGARGMIDALHGAAHAARSRNVGAARELLDEAGVTRDPRLAAALEAALEVLPPSQNYSGVALDGAMAAASGDFEALEKLRIFAFTERLPEEPRQLALWREEDDE